MFTEQVQKNIELNFKESHEKKQILDSYPYKLFLDVTSRCNLDCIICCRNLIKNADMSMDLFKKIEKEFFGSVAEVNYYLSGESCLSENLIKMLEIGSKYSFLPKIVINGTILSKELIEAFAGFGVFVNVSFDAANKRDFERIRKGSNFELVCKNVEKLVQASSKSHDRYHIRFLVTLRADTINQVIPIIEYAHKVGVNDILINFYEGYGSKEYMLFDSEKKLLPVVEESLALADKYKIRISWPKRVREKEFTKSNNYEDFKLNVDKFAPFVLESDNPYNGDCAYPWQEACISAEGDIISCCQGRHVMGNIQKQSFSEIWNNAKYQKLRNQSSYYICNGRICSVVDYSVSYLPLARRHLKQLRPKIVRFCLRFELIRWIIVKVHAFLKRIKRWMW